MLLQQVRAHIVLYPREERKPETVCALEQRDTRAKEQATEQIAAVLVSAERMREGRWPGLEADNVQLLIRRIGSEERREERDQTE